MTETADRTSLPSRERFGASTAADHRLLRVLLAQDGSTTGLCEALTGGPVQLHLLRQHQTDTVPAVVREHLPGTRFLERVITLSAQGQALLDAISFVALDGPALDPDTRAGLLEGRTPIGHLLDRLWIRREATHGALALHERLWAQVGLADPGASRAGVVHTPAGPLLMLAECFRGGLRLARSSSQP